MVGTCLCVKAPIQASCVLRVQRWVKHCLCFEELTRYIEWKFKSTISVSGIMCKVFGEQDLPLRGWKRYKLWSKAHLGFTSSSATCCGTLEKLLNLSEPQFLYLENGKSKNLSGHWWIQAINLLAHSVRGDYHHHPLSELRQDVHVLQASPGGDGGEMCFVKPWHIKQWLVITLGILVVHVHVPAQLLSHVWLCATPWTVAGQAPLSMRFSRQEYWSGLLIPPPGDLPNPVMEPKSPASPALAGGFFHHWAPGKPLGILIQS